MPQTLVARRFILGLRSTREAWASLLIIAGLGVVYAVVSRILFRAFPYSGDEYSNVLQAQIFAKGMLSVPAPAHPELFTVDHVVIDEWVRSKYPPGCAALLALGVPFGLTWLVTPVEATLALIFLRGAAIRTFGERAAVAAVLVAGLSSLFGFDAASFYSHTPVTLWEAVLMAASAASMTDSRVRWQVIAGMAIGFTFLTRPLDAAVFGLAVALTFWQLGKIRQIVSVGLTAAAIASAIFIYQSAQFDGPFRDGYTAWQPTFIRLYGRHARASFGMRYVFDLDEQWHHLDLLRMLLVQWTVPGAFLLAMVGALTIPSSKPTALPMRNFALALMGAAILALIPVSWAPDDGPPPRYLATMILPLSLLAGAGWAPFAEALGPRIGALWVNRLAQLFVGLGIVSFVSTIDARVPLLREREELYRAVAEGGVKNAVVTVNAKFPSRFLRNGPTFGDSVLYVAPHVASREVLASWFPGRTLYEATEGPPWSIQPLGFDP